MVYKTHIPAGFLLGLIVAEAVSEPLGTSAMIVGASVLGAIAPDIDTRTSTVSQKAPIVGRILRLFTHHRGMFHSPIFWTVLCVVISRFLSSLPYGLILGFYTGCISHVVMDMFTVAGVPVLWPLSRRKYHIGNIKTGGTLELVMRGLCVAGCLAVMLDLATGRILSAELLGNMFLSRV